MTDDNRTPTCPPNSSYFATLSECFEDTLTALPAFETAILLQRTCPGGIINTTEQLEALRFCTTISGSLIITINEPADFTSLHDIHFVTGWRGYMLPVSFMSHRAGALAIVNSSMTTMGVFFNLDMVSTEGGLYVIDGVGYAAVVSGSSADEIAISTHSPRQATRCWPM